MKFYVYDNGQKNITGERIRQARAIKHLSQSDLAAQMQLHGVVLERGAVGRIERFDRIVTDYELLTFADVLGVSVEWLLGREKGGSIFA